MTSGRLAVVTGTAHGIGAAIAARLSEIGYVTHAIDRVDCDITDPEAVSALIDKVGPVSVLVNNAGGVCGQAHKPLEAVTDDEWQLVMDANLTGAFYMTRAVVPGMKRAGWGRIVNIASGAGRSVSLTGIQAYTSAKAGLIGFTRQMAHELGEFGITVNCVAPGFMLSNPTTEAQWKGYGREGQRQLVRSIAMRRLGQPKDVAHAVAFFVDEATDWVTGQTLSVDGGRALF